MLCYFQCMSADIREPSSLHLYDCADVGATLVRYGRASGRDWRYLPIRDSSTDGPGMTGRLSRARKIAAWKSRRFVDTFRSDLVHVHFGTRLEGLNRSPRRPFVVHYHGTDIRSFYYDPTLRSRIQWGADNAAAVLYSTPDLKEHAEAARADAIYLPNPVDSAELPDWTPADEPTVVFASRWEISKGGNRQLEVLKAVREAVGPAVRIEGLDWGDGAKEARALGATLVPKMPKASYLRWLSEAHCVMGQLSGSLGMSELQALGIGVPLVAPLKKGFYPGAVPVLGGPTTEVLAQQVKSVLSDPEAAALSLQARHWIDANHAPSVSVERLAGIYRELA